MEVHKSGAAMQQGGSENPADEVVAGDRVAEETPKEYFVTPANEMKLEIEEPEEESSRFTCYHCKDGNHKDCVGVPCSCDCPDPHHPTCSHGINLDEDCYRCREDRQARCKAPLLKTAILPMGHLAPGCVAELKHLLGEN
jgi:hypothetical protein